MKAKIIKSLPLLLVLIFFVGCSRYGNYGNYGDLSDYSGYGNGNTKFGVTVWTSSDISINIYINNEQVGVISKKYEQAPECGSPGCVYYDTEDGGLKISIRGVSIDGTTSWEEKSLRLNRACRSVQLVKNDDGNTVFLMN
jgi:hypothetical protein